MGSPSSRLKTPESLRVWLESGLQYVFNPDGVSITVGQGGANTGEPATPPAGYPQPVTGHQAGNQPGVAQPQAPSPVQQPNQPAFQSPVQQQAHPAGQMPSPGTPPRDHSMQQGRAVPPAATQPVQPASVAPDAPARPSVDFPEPWAKYFSMVAATLPSIVLTYPELGMDLGGRPEKRRGVLLRNIKAHLKWPPGTMALWPCAAFINDALHPDPAMFWKGCSIWQPPYIACFGQEALSIIHPGAEPGRTVFMREHDTIYLLPSMDELMGRLPHEQQMAVDAIANLRMT